MHEGVRDAFLSLNRASSAWFLPLEMQRHRAALAVARRQGKRTYPDRFVYEPADAVSYERDLARIGETVSTIEDARLRSLVEGHVRSLQRKARCAASKDDELYVEYQVSDAGLPTSSLVEEATQIVEHAPAESISTPVAQDRVSANTLADAMRNAMKNYALEDWSVEIHNNMAAAASVNGALRRVRVQGAISISTRTAQRLVAHEIGGHVLRWENALAQSEAIASIPMGNTTLISEGLALWVESELQLMEPSQLFTYALRVLAVDLAQELGIMDLIEALRTWTDADTAISLALRVKRGLQDPNNKGGMTKDYCYLAGLQTINDMPKDHREAAQATQWAFEVSALAVELVADGTLQPPTRMPCSLKLTEDFFVSS